jgi:uncharacterized coiled-coil protein SlyX
MATVEERLAFLEGKVEEQSRASNGVGEAIRHLDQKVDRCREELAGRIDGLSDRLDALDEKVDRAVRHLDQKIDRFRVEMATLQVTVLLAVIGTFFGTLFLR